MLHGVQIRGSLWTQESCVCVESRMIFISFSVTSRYLSASWNLKMISSFQEADSLCASYQHLSEKRSSDLCEAVWRKRQCVPCAAAGLNPGWRALSRDQKEKVAQWWTRRRGSDGREMKRARCRSIVGSHKYDIFLDGAPPKRPVQVIAARRDDAQLRMSQNSCSPSISENIRNRNVWLQ